MRYRLSGGRTAATICAAALAVGLAPGGSRAQGPGAPFEKWTARGQGPGVSTYDVPDRPSDTRIPNPLPTGNPGGHGFYVGVEALFLSTNKTLGDQTVAVRGFIDSFGRITGLPGTLVGSGVPALTTDQFPRQGFNPAFNFTIGYKFEDGTSIYLTALHQFQQTLHAGATLAAPFFRSNPDLSDTFLTAAVFNFPPQYAGPLVKTAADADPLRAIDTNGDGVADTVVGTQGGNVYGIWNGASVMDIQFDQWYNAGSIGARVPLFQTEYTRIYGLAGGQYNMFMERFKWRTVSFDINGANGPRDAAIYTNTLSQRMYGAFVGCGHEAYFGAGFAGAVDVSAAGLINVIKERVKYKLQSDEIQNKMSRNDITFTPSLAANANLLWHPIQGVQLRVGYSANMFFNTYGMRNPIGFNYSNPDPVYDDQIFRIIHGVNVGVGLFF